MGLIKFIATFFIFYILIKVVQSVFGVNKVIKNAKEQHKKQKAHQQGDVIDAEYKVIDDND